MFLSGIEITSFIGILAAMGLAIDIALLTPFKEGSCVEAQGYTSKINEIQIFNTILNTWQQNPFKG